MYACLCRDYKNLLHRVVANRYAADSSASAMYHYISAEFLWFAAVRKRLFNVKIAGVGNF